MDFSEIGLVLLELLNQYGILGAVIIALSILVFKFADLLVRLSAEKLARGEHLFISLSRKKRKESIVKINKLLTELMNKLHADKAAVFEYHNGGYNLTGSPFMHFSLTILKNPFGVEELSKDFDNVLLSSIPDFILNLDTNDIYFIDNIEKLKSIFPRIYRELDKDDMKLVLFCNLEGVDDLVGFLMLAFKNIIDVPQKKVHKELFKKSLKMSSYLDGKRLKM